MLWTRWRYMLWPTNPAPSRMLRKGPQVTINFVWDIFEERFFWWEVERTKLIWSLLCLYIEFVKISLFFWAISFSNLKSCSLFRVSTRTIQQYGSRGKDWCLWSSLAGNFVFPRSLPLQLRFGSLKMRTLYELGQDTGKSWQAYKRSSNLIDATEVRDYLQSACHVENFTEV